MLDKTIFKKDLFVIIEVESNIWLLNTTKENVILLGDKHDAPAYIVMEGIIAGDDLNNWSDDVSEKYAMPFRTFLSGIDTNKWKIWTEAEIFDHVENASAGMA